MKPFKKIIIMLSLVLGFTATALAIINIPEDLWLNDPYFNPCTHGEFVPKGYTIIDNIPTIKGVCHCMPGYTGQRCEIPLGIDLNY